MPHEQITEDTLIRNNLVIQGLPFDVYQPWQAGDTLDSDDARSNNQTRSENVRNNMADRISEAKEEAAKNGLTIEPGSPEHAALQKEVTEYDLIYHFGLRSGGGGRTGDPVRAEAMEQAREIVRKALRAKGTPLKDVSSSKITEFANIVLEKNPQIMEAARKIVEDRKQFQITLDPGLLDNATVEAPTA